MRTWAIIPVKPLGQTKSRLQVVLSPAQRAAVTYHLLERTLAVLRAIAGIEQTLIVTPDAVVAQLGVGRGSFVLHERGPEGLNTAVAQGVAHVARLGVARALIVPSDLPLLEVDEVRLLLDATPVGGLALCSDQQGEGTNGLVLPAMTAFQFQYGPQSFRRHRQEAARRGLACRVVSAPGLAFDLDTAADWEALCRVAPALAWAGNPSSV